MIEKKARTQFLIGEYEQGVFVSMKAVEVRVRRLGGFDNDLVGVDLMNKAFRARVPRRRPAAQRGASVAACEPASHADPPSQRPLP